MAYGNLDELVSISERFDTLDDWPWNRIRVIEAMRDAYGERAVFVLNTRDPDEWFSSYVRFRKHSRKPLEMEPGESENDFKKRFLLERDENIRALFQSCPERLLEVNISAPDFMERLQEFTGYNLKSSLPHVNKTPEAK